MTVSTFYVRVTTEASVEALGEDSGVAGLYAVSGHLAAHACAAQAVTDVLNAFHEEQGIENLDLFEIVVMDEQGAILMEPDLPTPGVLTAEYGSLSAEWVAEALPTPAGTSRRRPSV